MEYISECTGERMHIKCEPGYKISISRVYFGVKGDRKCADGRKAYSENCCRRSALEDCMFIDTNIQDSVNTLCSGRQECKPSVRGIPARRNCRRNPEIAPTDKTDFKSVYYNCIPGKNNYMKCFVIVFTLKEKLQLAAHSSKCY